MFEFDPSHFPYRSIQRRTQYTANPFTIGCSIALYADIDGRTSLAWNLIQLLRLTLDDQLIDWIQTQKWRKRDFEVNDPGTPTLGYISALLINFRPVLTPKPLDVDHLLAATSHLRCSIGQPVLYMILLLNR